MRKLLLSLALAGFLFPQPALATPKPKGDWIRVETENFVLYSNARETLTTNIGLNLERFRRVLCHVTSKMEFNSPVPTSIYVFRGTQSFDRYVTPNVGHQTLVGLFTKHRDGNFVAVNAAPVEDPFQIIYHEYTHFFLHNNMQTAIPLWFDEGMAEYYSSFTVRENVVEVGRPHGLHIRWLRTNELVPLERLFAVDHDSPEYSEDDKTGVFYAQSWALIHYLRSGSPERSEQLFAFIGALSDGTPIDEAFRESFKTDYGQLLEELKHYVVADLYKYTRYKFAELDVDTDVDVRPMAPAEVLYRLGDYLAHSGPERAEEAEEHFKAALEIEPDHGLAMSGLAFLLDRQGRHEEAAGYHKRALATAAEDFLANYLYAESLTSKYVENAGTMITREGPLPPLLAGAREHFRKAITLNPGYGPAYAGLGYTYLYDPGDLTLGIQVTEKARSLLPQDEGIAYNLFLLYLYDKDVEAARELERTVLRHAEDPELRRLAREALLQEELEEANELLAAGKIEEGTAVVERVLRETGDPSLKRALDQHLREIRQLGETRRLIDRYSMAVEMAKQGKLDGAMEILDEVLEKASDPDLVKAAVEMKKAIEELRERGGDP